MSESSIPIRKDSGVDLELEDEPIQKLWDIKKLFRSKSTKSPQHNHPLHDPTSHSDPELKRKGKVLSTNMEANKDLSIHIKTRPQMDMEERVLRTDIYLLESKVADRRRVFGAHQGDHTEKSERLRCQLEEKRSQLKGVLERKRRLEDAREELSLRKDLKEAMESMSV